MIKVAIIEDDDSAAEKLSEYLERFGTEASESFSIKRYKDGLSFLDGYPGFELVFMDIEMPFITGMEAAKRLRNIDTKAVLIFVTNMAQYAVKGYEVDALDFIVKPLAYSDFSFKMKRALRAVLSSRDDEVIIQLKDGLRRINTSDIYYIEIHGHTLTYHLYQDSFEVRGRLSDARDQFKDFLQCNNCYLVNPEHIDWVKGYEVKAGEDILAISHPRRREFMDALSAWYAGNGGSK